MDKNFLLMIGHGGRAEVKPLLGCAPDEAHTECGRTANVWLRTARAAIMTWSRERLVKRESELRAELKLEAYESKIKVLEDRVKELWDENYTLRATLTTHATALGSTSGSFQSQEAELEGVQSDESTQLATQFRPSGPSLSE